MPKNRQLKNCLFLGENLKLRRLNKKAIASAVLGIVLALAGTQGASAAPPVETKEQIVAQIKVVVANLEGSGLTGSDKAFLARHPDIAEQIIDPSKTTHAAKNNTTPQLMASGCYYSEWYTTWRSITGGVVYRYHTVGSLCYNGYTTAIHNNYGYFSMVDGIYVVENNNEINNLIPSGTSTILHTQGRIKECILYYGCFQEFHPWGKTTIRPNGSSYFTWGG